ncbi:colicin V synthesis protein [Rubrivivax gelatinosus]|nr:colicin V synthesis protein [Rubrivivax gelatinosus]
MPDLGWVDWTLAAVLVVSTVVGLVRGFVFEAMALAGWVVAWFAAHWFSADLARHLPVGTPGGAINHGAAFALTFIAALVAWSLLARLVRLLVHATPLSPADRALGAGFGLLRGAVVLLVLATVVAWTPVAQSPSWRQSHGAMWLNTAMQGLKPVLPVDLARQLPA